MYLKFNLYSNEVLEKNSIIILNKNNLIDNTTSYTLNPQLPCKQCKKVIECPGHTGRIPLYHKIVHPLFVNLLCKELMHICPICKKYNTVNDIKSTCCNKRIVSTTFTLHKISIPDEFNKNRKSKKKSENKTYLEYAFSFGNQWLSVDKMYDIISSSDFSMCPDLQQKLLNIFLKNIPVLPINMRPSIIDSSNVTIHSNITSLYVRLIDLNYHYQNEKSSISKNSYILRCFNLYKKILGIHNANDSVEDTDKTFIKQILSGKNGIFRSMCLAKRQNFCLRSVIVPNIDTPLDVVLIPKIFTDQLIPFGYKPNDYVIINRQPTLQTTSLLAIHSYPSNSHTIQINPLIASVFQADFDGDEMNIFWLPGDQAKKEMASKLNIANNIRSFKNASLMIKFIQDTLTGIYNMTRDQNTVEPFMIEKICKKLEISNKKWSSFKKYYKSKMNTTKVTYSHLISLLIPKTLTVYHSGNLLVDQGILVNIINNDNQVTLLNAIMNYGNRFYLKFMWDVQRMVHEYNLFHIITISISDCIGNTDIEDAVHEIHNNITTNMYEKPLCNIDTQIINQNTETETDQIGLKGSAFVGYFKLVELVNSIDNNLTNIVKSGSKGNKDNIIQILMSIGIQTVLPSCYIKNCYSKGLSAKELFIHSKSGRVGIISTSLNTSSTGYLQRELVKSMEDLLTDKNGIVWDYSKNKIYHYPFSTNTRDIDDTFLEYAFAMSNV